MTAAEAPYLSTPKQHVRFERMFGAIRVRVTGSPRADTHSLETNILPIAQQKRRHTKSTTPVCPSARVSLSTVLASEPEAMGCPDSETARNMKACSWRLPDKAILICPLPSPVALLPQYAPVTRNDPRQLTLDHHDNLVSTCYPSSKRSFIISSHPFSSASQSSPNQPAPPPRRAPDTGATRRRCLGSSRRDVQTGMQHGLHELHERLW